MRYHRYEYDGDVGTCPCGATRHHLGNQNPLLKDANGKLTRTSTHCTRPFNKKKEVVLREPKVIEPIAPKVERNSDELLWTLRLVHDEFLSTEIERSTLQNNIIGITKRVLIANGEFNLKRL